MSQLHSLLVIDSETREIHITGIDEAPVDSKGVWDTEREVWRYPTDAELDNLLDVEDQIISALVAAGLRT